MEAANFTMWVGFGLIAVALLLFSFLLIVVGWFYACGYVLGTIEVVRFGVQTIFEMSVAYSYLTA
jgi:hypothetical protein